MMDQFLRGQEAVLYKFSAHYLQNRLFTILSGMENRNSASITHEEEILNGTISII